VASSVVQVQFEASTIAESSSFGAGLSLPLESGLKTDQLLTAGDIFLMFNGVNGANSFDYFYHATINPRWTGVH
jgi:hypothetical protein